MKKIILAILLINLVIIGGCKKDVKTNNQTNDNKSIIITGTNNTEIKNEVKCGDEYQPVCGIGNNGEEDTYDNMCYLEKEGAKLKSEGTCTNEQINFTTGESFQGLTGEVEDLIEEIDQELLDIFNELMAE